MSDIAERLEREGFYLLRGAATDEQIAPLRIALSGADIARSERGGDTYGARGLLQISEVRAVANMPATTAALRHILGESFLAVRSLFFDKTAGANWPVLWHQDLSLALRDRHNLPGWRNWSIKRGINHGQPPPEILARMVTIRLHLDDGPAENGALQVLPGTHRPGRPFTRRNPGFVHRSGRNRRGQGRRRPAHAPPNLARIKPCPDASPSTGAASGIRTSRPFTRRSGVGGSLICCRSCCSKECNMSIYAAAYAAR